MAAKQGGWSMDRVGLGKRINEARKIQNLTGEKLAELCSINATYLRQIAGGAKIPSLPVFVLLCDNLKVSPNFLLKDTLSDNEYTGISELAQLLNSATPDQLKLITAMIQAAIKVTDEL